MDRYIERGAISRIQSGPGTLLHVRSGALWVTQPGDFRDYYMKPGQRFRVAGDGLVLAYAMEPASVTILAPAQRQPGGWLGGLPRRLARFWTRAFVPSARPTTAAF